MSVFNAPVASMDMPTGLKVRFKGEKVPVVLQFGNRIKAPGGFLGIGLDGSKNLDDQCIEWITIQLSLCMEVQQE